MVDFPLEKERFEASKILSCLKRVVENQLTVSNKMKMARIQQAKEYEAASKSLSKQKSTQELDKILNPDKYHMKTTSTPRVDSTRYKPSESAQARRKVTKSS